LEEKKIKDIISYVGQSVPYVHSAYTDGQTCDETLILLPESLQPVLIRVAIVPLTKLTDEVALMLGPQVNVKVPLRSICP
jgi:hypothetical protein